MPLRLFSIVLSITLLLLPSRRNTAELPLLLNVFPATVLPENGLPHTFSLDWKPTTWMPCRALPPLMVWPFRWMVMSYVPADSAIQPLVQCRSACRVTLPVRVLPQLCA